MPLSLIAVLVLLIAPVPDVVEAPEIHAPLVIRGLTIIAAPGEKLENASLVITDGRITAVGVGGAVPAGARVVEGAGLFAYAGFIDAFSRTGVSEARVSAAEERRVEDRFESVSEGPRVHMDLANRNGIRARRTVEDVLDFQEKTYDEARRAGFTAALIAPPRGVLGGQASLLLLGDEPLRRSVLRSGVGQTASFAPPGFHAIRERDRYPSTTFGVIAHFRQTMLDADWFRQMNDFARKNPGAAVPYDEDLAALQDVLSGNKPLIWEADDADEIHRVLDLAAEFRFKPMLVGVPGAYKAAQRIKQTNTPVLLTLKLPKKAEEFKLEPQTLRKTPDDISTFGREWEKRPFESRAAYEEARRLRDEELRNAIELEKAGIAWCATAYDLKKPRDALDAMQELIEAGLPVDAALRAMTVTPARVLGMESELGTLQPGKRANVTILTKPLGEKQAKVRMVVVNGHDYEFDTHALRKDGKDGEKSDDATSKPATAPASQPASGPSTRPDVAATKPAVSQPTSTQASQPAGPLDDLVLHDPVWPVETPAQRDPGVHTDGNVLLKNALVLTASGDDLPNTDVLVEGGKIKAIGKDLAAPAGVKVIDLSGYVIMPGVVDPHSHIALDSVNEFSLSVTCEVRCEDVVNSQDLNIYRALAGGCTTIHAMHGSANTIGGQCVVLKLKYGRPAAELIVRDRHRTVKFATGENVKRPGLPTPGWVGELCEPRIRRFPGSRMGVEATMRRALAAGRAYAEERAAYEAAKVSGTPPPLRRDIRLDALADILAGEIWVNCHCYRADEILRLLSVAEDFGFRINNLHHVLEGYRIMPEILRHGVGTTTFSDWWAYKVEAYDAVPHNAGMLLRYGIDSTIKSDSADLMRHLPFEASKCMKYSGLTGNEALRLVTLNGARQFGLEARIGSIDVGKDADIAVYDGHPLDSFAKCVLTLVDGEVYFRHRDFDVGKPARPLRPLKTFTAPMAKLRPVTGMAAALDSNAAPQTEAMGAGRAPDEKWQRLIAGGASKRSYALINATVHPISAPAIENGVVLMQGGKITAVGPSVQTPADAEVLDAKGLHVYPGLINAATTVGMNEIEMVEVTIDTADTAVYQPDLMAASGFNPHSAMVEVTRADGVLTVLLVPGGGNVAGQAGLIDLDGWTMPEMLRDQQLALVVSLPSKKRDALIERRPKPDYESDEPEAETPLAETQKQLAELARFFADAKVYARSVVEARRSNVRPPLPADPRFDALVPYALGEKPVLFAADAYKNILEALLFAETLELRPIILGGREAWKLADVLAARRVPVIYDSVFAMPRGVESVPTASEEWDANYRALSILAKAGVKFCVANRSASLAKQLPTDAGFAVAHGLDADVVLRAITLSAAEILGVADRLGSLEVGKDANLIVTTEHPCQATNVVKYAFIRGKPISLASKHTRDAERFANRPPPVLAPPRTDLKGPPSQSRPNGVK